MDAQLLFGTASKLPISHVYGVVGSIAQILAMLCASQRIS